MSSDSSLRRVPSSGAAEIGYPKGHLGQLNEHETQALAEFKALLEEKGLYKPGPPPSHDDPTLIRFLRARKWVPKDAYGQFNDTEQWRNGNDIEKLYDTIDVDIYEASRKLYPRFTGHRDKRGIPIYVYQIAHLESKAISDYEKLTQTTYKDAKTDGKTPIKLLPLFSLYENLTRFVQGVATECTDREHVETPITLSTTIVDISHVSLRMFWNLKAHMQAASQLATAHYPETLDRIFIIGAPYFFSTVWGWIKRWFDPVTVSKIFILSPQDVLPVLTTFMDEEAIPKNYGGKLDWGFFDEPAWDDHIMGKAQWENGYTSFPLGPCYWEPTEDGTRIKCIAVGSKDGKQRREVICTFPKAIPAKSAASEKATESGTDAGTETPATNGTTEKTTPEAASAANAETTESATAESTADAVADLKITEETKS